MKTVLITGANRGIGLEFVKQLADQGIEVLACCRDPKKAKDLIQLADANANIKIFQLDVIKQDQIDTLHEELKDKAIDWLINNAGISGASGVTVGNIDRSNFLKVMNVNCLSPVKMAEAFIPNLEKSHDKLILNISSAMGSITENESGRSYAYRTSKAALNCVMHSFAIDVMPLGIKVILLHPGWVETDMGGEDALIGTATSVSGMLKQVQQHKQDSHAEVLRRFDGGTISW